MVNESPPASKVLLISHCGRWGGAQKVLYLLVAGLRRTRLEPVVVVPHEGPLAVALRGLGVDVIVRPVPWWVGARGSPEACAGGFIDGCEQRVAFLEQLIADRAIDVVFSNTLVIADGALAASRAGVPHVWQALELLSRDPSICPPVALAAFYGAVTSLSDKVVAVSEAVRQEIAAFTPIHNVEVIHTGLPHCEHDGRPVVTDRPPAEAGKRVTFVGLFSERKGVVSLVEAAPRVLEQHPDAVFWLVGPDGGALAAVHDRIRRHGIAPHVSVLGERDDVDGILAGSAVSVLPATADPLPLAVIEAMRAGVPVVATRSGGCEEMVVDGTTGFLVPVGDVHALADRICRLLDDPDLARAMGRRGRERFADHFSHEAFVGGFERLLLDVIRRERRTEAATARTVAAVLARESYAVVARLHAARAENEAAQAALREQLDALREHRAAPGKSRSRRRPALLGRTVDSLRRWCGVAE